MAYLGTADASVGPVTGKTGWQDEGDNYVTAGSWMMLTFGVAVVGIIGAFSYLERKDEKARKRRDAAYYARQRRR